MRFGLGHYDRTINGFIQKLCAAIALEGLVDPPGLVRPFFGPRPMDRASLIAACRFAFGPSERAP